MNKAPGSENKRFIVSSLDAWRLDNLLEDMGDAADREGEQLLASLRKGSMVGPREIPPNVVTMNCLLAVIVQKPAKNHIELKLVYPADADEENNKVSIFSPLGRTLIGMTEGETRTFKGRSGGRSTITVEKILYQPEREGHFQV